MASLLRASAIVVLILAVAGCQQAKRPGAEKDASAKKAQGGGAGSKGGETRAPARGAGEAGTADGSSRARGSALTAEDDSRAFDLRQGQVLTVVLDSNRSIGLSWVMVDPPGTVIVREGSPVYALKAGARGKGGSGGAETWRFRAARPGRQTVRLEYRRQWQGAVPERTFRFTATVR